MRQLVKRQCDISARAAALLVVAGFLAYRIREAREEERLDCRLEQITDRFAECSYTSFVWPIMLAAVAVAIIAARIAVDKRAQNASRAS